MDSNHASTPLQPCINTNEMDTTLKKFKLSTQQSLLFFFSFFHLRIYSLWSNQLVSTQTQGQPTPMATASHSYTEETCEPSAAIGSRHADSRTLPPEVIPPHGPPKPEVPRWYNGVSRKHVWRREKADFTPCSRKTRASPRELITCG